MARLQFADFLKYSGGAYETIVNLYEVPINPIEMSEPGLSRANTIGKIGGPATYMYGVYESDVRTLTWKMLPARSEFQTMIDTIKDYRRAYKMIRIGTAGIDHKEDWFPIYVIDVEVEYPNAPGTRHYCTSLTVSYAIQRDWGYSCALAFTEPKGTGGELWTS